MKTETLRCSCARDYPNQRRESAAPASAAAGHEPRGARRGAGSHGAGYAAGLVVEGAVRPVVTRNGLEEVVGLAAALVGRLAGLLAVEARLARYQSAIQRESGGCRGSS